MSFPRYEQYKESGVELLGEIPQIWDVWKSAHAFARIGSGTTPKSDQPEYYDEGTIPWVNTGDLADGPLAACAKKVTEKAASDYSSLKLHPSGSLLFAMYGATIGKLGILKFPATVNQACCVFSGDSPIAVKFLFYWFLGLRDKILSLATGGG
jgi:type I restriction enzyme S subunit